MRFKVILVICIVLLVSAVLYIYLRDVGKTEERFTDIPGALAQRQMLQMEGEQRYNHMARLQGPRAALDPTLVDAALTQAIPMETTSAPSLMSLLGFTELGAYAQPGRSTGVEQTGAVQAKIDFCESQTTINCGLLSSDPRMAECGFCHRDGINSKGKAHRGGLYISSDDQIRANEAAGGGRAIYGPTIGSCDTNNFTLMPETCLRRERQLQCQTAGAPSSSNECGQCFGQPAANATGLLYMGQKPRQFTAILHISHPGSGGTTLTFANNKVMNIPGSSQSLVDPQQITIDITEGDRFTIQIQGAPALWCGWLASPSGLRTVSLDVAEQSMSPENGFLITGDSRSSAVTSAIAASSSTTWLSSVPNTVLWFQRNNQVLSPMPVAAVYGLQQQGAVDVLSSLSQQQGQQGQQQQGQQQVSPATLLVTDPAPDQPKHLWITQDTGNTLILADGDTIPATQNAITLSIVVPATLVDPVYAEDNQDCPTGPIVLTEAGAGIMGSHSCFAADGSFNPSVFCMQRLFQAAGGTPKGTLYPTTDAAATALDKGGLDATMAWLNTQTNLAIYGVDAGGAPQPFSVVKEAALAMLGVVMSNPCDGPNAAKGPHSPECLDFLWRTSGDPDAALSGDPSTLPYAYCGAGGAAAPLNLNGSVKADAARAANSQGTIPAIRAYFQGFFNRSQNSSNFDVQAAAMRSCYGAYIKPIPETPDSCPPANPDEWQCFGPQQVQSPEVFLVNTGGYSTPQADGPALCGTYGATFATTEQLQTAYNQGAQWCTAAWVSDKSDAGYYPMQTADPNCGNATGLVAYGADFLPKNSQTGQPMAAINCYGKKPPSGTPDVQPFNGSSWYNPNAVPAPVSDSAVMIGKELANKLYCGSADGSGCQLFPDMGSCRTFLASAQAKNLTPIELNAPVGSGIDRYVRDRV